MFLKLLHFSLTSTREVILPRQTCTIHVNIAINIVTLNVHMYGNKRIVGTFLEMPLLSLLLKDTFEDFTFMSAIIKLLPAAG